MSSKGRTVKVTIVGDARGVREAFSELGAVSQSLLGQWGALAGAGGAVGLALMLKRLGGDAIGLARDFETAMAKIEGLAGHSSEQVAAWAGQIKRLAPEVGQSPTALADALYYLSSAGLESGQVMKVLDASARAASAGLGRAEDVARLTAAAVNAYGEENLSAERAVDILVAAVREGSAEADEMASSMGRVLPIASELGIGFDEVAAATASMTTLGLGAEEAVTALRGIMSTLLKPSQQANKTLQAFGTSASELRQRVKDEGLLAVLLDLKARFGDNEEALAKVFPNVRALAGVLNLVGENAEGAAATFTSVADSSGSLNRAFGIISDTADFKLKQALAGLQVVGVDVGSKVLPSIVSIVEQAKPVVQALGDAFALVAQIIGAIAPAVSAVLKAIGPLVGPIGAAATAALALHGAGKLLTAGFQAVRLAMIKIQFGTFGSSIQQLTRFVNPLTVGIAAGVAVFQAWSRAKQEARKRAEEFRQTLDEETGAVTANTREWVRKQLTEAGVLGELTSMGVSVRELTDAYTGNSAALETVRQKIDAAGGPSFELMQVLGKLDAAARDAAAAQEELAAATELERLQAAQAAVESERLEGMTRGRAAALRDTADAAREAEDADAAFEEAMRQAAPAVGEMWEKLQQLNRETEAAVETHDRATKTIAGTWAELPGLISKHGGDVQAAIEEMLELSRQQRQFEANMATLGARGLDRVAQMLRDSPDAEAAKQAADYFANNLVEAAALEDKMAEDERLMLLAMDPTGQASRVYEQYRQLGIGLAEGVLTGFGQPVLQPQLRAPSITWQPGADGTTLTPVIGGYHLFAKGGIVTGPTPALIGEHGDEAVIPLNERGMGLLVRAIAEALHVGQRPAPAGIGKADIRVELDGREIARVLEAPLLERIRLRAGSRRL